MDSSQKNNKRPRPKTLIGTAVILLFLGSAGALAAMIFSDGPDREAYSPQKHIASSDKDPVDEKWVASVRDLHDLLNDLTGYGKIQGFDFKKHESDLFYIQQELALLTASISNPDVKMDLQNAHDLADYASEYSDIETLRYTHRVLHDLDKDLNNYSGTHDYFYVTHNGSGKNLKTVTGLLER